MSNNDNNIALYSEAPSPVTIEPQQSVQPANYNNPLRLKICIPNKKDSFTAYNIPLSLPINGYMAYNYRLSGSNKEYTGTAKIYPISSNSILSQNNINNLSVIFDINSKNYDFPSKYSNPTPVNAYLDFSGFNTVAYSNYQSVMNYYRVAYIDSTVTEGNPYRYTSEIKPSTVMMQNIGWVNNTDELKSYIGTYNLDQFVVNFDTLGSSQQINSFKEYYMNFLRSAGSIMSVTKWNNDAIAGPNKCMPVSWDKNTQCLLYFDSTNARITINGFSQLWNMSKFERNSALVNQFQKAPNNTAWISQIDLYNKGDNDKKRFNNTYNYFLIYDSMPVQYKPNNAELFQIEPRFIDAQGKTVTIKPFTYASNCDEILKNIKCSVVMSTNYQTLPDSLFNTNRFITTEYNINYNQFSYIIKTSHLSQFNGINRNGKQLDSTYIIQFNKYKINPSTYLGSVDSSSESSHTNFYIYLNRPNNDCTSVIKDYTHTIIPLRYKLNDSSETEYTSYVYYNLSVHTYLTSSTIPEIISKSSSNGEMSFFNDNLNVRNNEYISNINNNYHTLDLKLGRTNKETGKFEQITSVKPMVSVNTDYTTQKIHFKYNGLPFNVKKGIDGKKLFEDSTIYYSISSDNLGNNTDYIITDLVGNDKTSITNNIRYTSSSNNTFCYLLHTSYAICKTGDSFYNDNITFRLDDSVTRVSSNEVDKLKTPGIYCYITGVNKNNISVYDTSNNSFIIGGFNWYNGTFGVQEPTVNFIKVTQAPDKKLIYRFGNSKTDSNTTVMPHSVIISSANKPVGYMLYSDGETPMEITMQAIVTGSSVQVTTPPLFYINSGFYTDNYETGKKSINVFKGLDTAKQLDYYGDYNCSTNPPFGFVNNPSVIKPGNDNTLLLTLSNSIKNVTSSGTEFITYLDVNSLINENTCINILPSGITDKDLAVYYKESASSVFTDIFIDSTEKSELLTLGGTYNQAFSEPITLYAQISNVGNMKLTYRYTPVIGDQYGALITKSDKVSGNVTKLNGIYYDSTSTNISYKDRITYLHSIQLGNGSEPLSFNITASMANSRIINCGDIILDYPTDQPSSNKYYIDLTKKDCSYRGAGSGNDLIDNRFLLMNGKNTPSRDIIHETLKYVAGQYKCDYLNRRYDDNIGIDIYMHQYYGPDKQQRQYDDSTYYHSVEYKDRFTRHYIYNIDTDIDQKDFKGIYVDNIYYNIKNDTGIDIIIDSTVYHTNSNIYVHPDSSGRLDFYDLIEISRKNSAGNIKYNDFRYCIYELDHVSQAPYTLTAYIDTIKPSDSKKYSTEILNPDKWIDNERIKFNLENIKDINDYDRQYSLVSNYSIANINLSDIIKVKDNNIINVKQVKFGFQDDRFDIPDYTGIYKYNKDWPNLLTFIEKNTSENLSDYVQFQIANFSITNWNQNNCYLKYSGEFVETTDTGKVEIRTISDNIIYSLFNTDYQPFEIPYNVSGLNFQYQISLSNYRFVMKIKLFRSKNSDKSEDIILYFRLGNSNLVSEILSGKDSNDLDFGTLYIKDKYLANINNNQPGCLYFNPISDDEADDYTVLIDFYDEEGNNVGTTPKDMIIVSGGQTKIFNLHDYIKTNIQDVTVHYISVKQIMTKSGDISKYILSRR